MWLIEKFEFIDEIYTTNLVNANEKEIPFFQWNLYDRLMGKCDLIDGINVIDGNLDFTDKNWILSMKFSVQVSVTNINFILSMEWMRLMVILIEIWNEMEFLWLMKWMQLMEWNEKMNFSTKYLWPVQWMLLRKIDLVNAIFIIDAMNATDVKI